MSAFGGKADMALILYADFFGQSAVSSSSQSISLASHLVCGPDISMFSILSSNSFSL